MWWDGNVTPDLRRNSLVGKNLDWTKTNFIIEKSGLVQVMVRCLPKLERSNLKGKTKRISNFKPRCRSGTGNWEKTGWDYENQFIKDLKN